MKIFNIILFSILFTLSSLPTIAARGVSNLTCHHCRISKNRAMAKKSKPIEYIACSNPECNKTWCGRCIENGYVDIEKLRQTKNAHCPHCIKDCCCNFNVCKKEHEHCFTYKRTLSRRAKEQKKPKWVKMKADDTRGQNKKKKDKSESTSDDSEDSSSDSDSKSDETEGSSSDSDSTSDDSSSDSDSTSDDSEHSSSCSTSSSSSTKDDDSSDLDFEAGPGFENETDYAPEVFCRPTRKKIEKYEESNEVQESKKATPKLSSSKRKIRIVKECGGVKSSDINPIHEHIQYFKKDPLTQGDGSITLKRKQGVYIADPVIVAEAFNPAEIVPAVQVLPPMEPKPSIKKITPILKTEIVRRKSQRVKSMKATRSADKSTPITEPEIVRPKIQRVSRIPGTGKYPSGGNLDNLVSPPGTLFGGRELVKYKIREGKKEAGQLDIYFMHLKR